MSDPQTPVIPAGWHPDPAGTPRNRWWDGQQWTETYAEPEAAAVPQPPVAPASPAAYTPGTPFETGAPYTAAPAATFAAAPYAAAAPPLVAPAGVPIYTSYVWFIVGVVVLLPILSITIFSSSTIESITGAGSSSPASLLFSGITNLLGFAGYGAGVWLAYLDHRTLTRAGVPSPFHWAFAFISSIVYLIGRGFVMKRRTGKGMITAWIGIGIVAATTLAIIAVVVVVIGLVTQAASY